MLSPMPKSKYPHIFYCGSMINVEISGALSLAMDIQLSEGQIIQRILENLKNDLASTISKYLSEQKLSLTRDLEVNVSIAATQSQEELVTHPSIIEQDLALDEKVRIYERTLSEIKDNVKTISTQMATYVSRINKLNQTMTTMKRGVTDLDDLRMMDELTCLVQERDYLMKQMKEKRAEINGLTTSLHENREKLIALKNTTLNSLDDCIEISNNLDLAHKTVFNKKKKLAKITDIYTQLMFDVGEACSFVPKFQQQINKSTNTLIARLQDMDPSSKYHPLTDHRTTELGERTGGINPPP